ncbi:MAG: ribose-phosphate pyrophosphokinase [bacterium]
MEKLKIFTGNSNIPLTEKICQYLKTSTSSATVDRFLDGEIEVKLGESVRGNDIFIIQSTNPPSDNLFELLLMIDAASRASAKRITAVIPYFGYSRQDKKDEPRVPISSKLIANLLSKAGANRVLTIDLHAAQVQGFFDIPVDNLYSTPIIIEHLKQFDLKEFVIVAPDVGGAKRASGIAKRMGNLELCILNKQRPSPDKAYITNVVGNVEGKNALILDDIISTGTTIINGATALKQRGAKKVYCFCTHPVLAGEAVEKIENSELEALFVTDTILIKKQKNLPEGKASKIKVLSISNLLGEAITRIHSEDSVSSLFIDY